MQYGERGENGRELYDLAADPGQFVNLAQRPEHVAEMEQLGRRLTEKLREVRAGAPK